MSTRCPTTSRSSATPSCRAKTDEFKKRLADGETLDDLLPEAFAVAREAAWRVLDQRPFDVQVMGAAALHLGNVAEMKTGEGKTLTCVLPAYLNALAGEGVHIVTVNDYLAKRDSEWMGRVHRFLGLQVGVILAQMTPEQRRVAYNADITYGTNNEFGFDYLRDNMAHSLDDLVQRGHNFAIVDEVDSILIDEARTPLIISGPADSASNWYTEFARLAPLMEKDVHYEVDLRKRTVGVHELGVEFVEDQLGIDNLYEAANSPLVSYLNNALKAKELFNRDKDYIVRDGEVLIVDEFTGRVLIGRRYNEGMHQAIEAKEHVEIKAENQTLATITLQNYFRLYDKLAGMTGTAQTEAAELHEIYKLGVVSIPTNKAMIREDQSDLIYKTEEAKYIAVVDDVAERYEKGQPVLIGTTSVERSEYLSRQFTEAAHPAQRAQRQVPRAGGGASSPRRAVAAASPWPPTWPAAAPTSCWAATSTSSPTCGCAPAAWIRWRRPTSTRRPGTRNCRMVKEEAAAEAKEVIEAGGLYVLGTERHESRRIDNQLRGRSGRQGDPGESRFYLSLGDELMRRFNGAMLESMLTRINLPDDVPIESKMVTRAIKSAQTQVEQQNFEVRKNVLKYDEVMNQQRKVIYAERRRILEGENLQQQATDMLVDVITAYVDGATSEGYAEDWDLDALWTALKTLYPVGIKHEDADPPGRRLRARRAHPRRVARRAAQRRRTRLCRKGSRARGASRRRRDAPAGTQRAAQRHRPQVARAPLRDGLPQGGHRAARDGAARPAGGVPARGLRHVHGHARRHEGGVGRLPVQRQRGGGARPAGGARWKHPKGLAEFAAAAATRAARCAERRAARRAPSTLRAKGIDDEAPALTYSGPSEDGSAQVQRNGGGAEKTPAGVPAGASRRERRAAARQQGRGAKPPKSVKRR